MARVSGAEGAKGVDMLKLTKHTEKNAINVINRKPILGNHSKAELETGVFRLFLISWAGVKRHATYESCQENAHA